VLFQPFDLVTDRRRGDVQLLGGDRETQTARRSDEGSQGIQRRETFGWPDFRTNFSILIEQKRSIAAMQLTVRRPVSIFMPLHGVINNLCDITIMVHSSIDTVRRAVKGE
jgi:hypothetical protein